MYVVFTTDKHGSKGIASDKRIEQLHNELNNSLAFSVSIKSDIQQLHVSQGGIWILFTDGTLLTYGQNSYGSLGLSYHVVHSIILHWCKTKVIPHDIITLIENFSPYKIVPGQILFPIFNTFAMKHKIKLICSGSSNHRFLVTNDNHIYGVGWNAYKQLGAGKDGYSYNHFIKMNYFKSRNINIAQIECGTTSTNFVTADGDLYVCGQATAVGTSQKKRMKIPIKVMCLKSKLKKICCGSGHVLGVSMSQILLCGGSNIYGQCGFDNRDDSKYINGLKENMYFRSNKILLKDIAVGLDHSMVLDTNGKVYSFGKNEWYQCGNGMKQSVCTPWCNTYLEGLVVIEIQCGNEHNMARTAENYVYFWGLNRSQQCLLFQEDRNFVETPHQVLRKFADLQIVFCLADYETIILCKNSKCF